MTRFQLTNEDTQHTHKHRNGQLLNLSKNFNLNYRQIETVRILLRVYII